ncbi:4-hydroxyphenylacetate 3-hydroxylase N-terminal domain-containing protein [Megasphaera paucivorans]|uniref:4-hydroxybutyryl-CoA dehydratase / vinylacetyl-CoA-Delta-isomerase n=1 Tax=Megasphaera paucivorans TaxID=349095 RepID=A0A1G9RXI7_9FIRM|nr:4-hydroxyphenylacetate 3-hydroxylase N-terminal domain-containing protein [Megasphaera paucivorans]SDM27979.1 4-hydroxybutyryl-CoA dehydratase / vinylacetyl-CoA-Delta-isomerase [Megasphaera paucivorans]
MLMTKKQFQDSIRARNPMNVWFLGKKIENLTAFPPLAASFNAISKVYELAQRPAWKDLITVKSHLNGEDVSIYNAPLRSAEDANRKTRAARALAEVIGCCTHRCTGSEAFAGLGPACYDMDHDLGTHYFERFMTFLDYVQKHDLTCTVTVTDVKGLRTLPPHAQPDKDMYVHVDEIRDDGIVISGFKCNQTGILFAHEIVIVPTTNMKPEDKDFAVACAVPADSPGITFVLGRTPQDKRFFEVNDDIEGIDLGKKYADHQALVYFDKVFVPNDRVFLCGEVKYVGRLLSYFTAVHRLTAGGCKAGGCSALCGAASLIADMIGVQKAGHIRTKLTEMSMTAETVYGLSLASGVEGFQHPSGFWIPNPLMSHTCKYTCTKIPFDAVRYARDILAGFGETAPSEMDMRSAGVGSICQRAFNPGNPDYTALDRLRASRFIEHMVRGSNWTAMALHGGGNQEASTVMARMYTDWDYVKELVKVAAGIEKDTAKAEEFLDSIGKRKGRICNYGDLPKIDKN